MTAPLRERSAVCALIAEVRAAYRETKRRPCRGNYIGGDGTCDPLTALALQAGVTMPADTHAVGAAVAAWARERFGHWQSAGISRGWDGLPRPADYALANLDRPAQGSDGHYPSASRDWLAGYAAGVALAEAIFPLERRELT